MTMSTMRYLILSAAILMTACSTPPVSYSNNDNSDLVVIIHGLTRSGRSMSELNQRLLDAGYQTCVLDYSSVGVSINELITDTDKQIHQCTEEAKVVHLVGHSLGGLLIRYHLQADDALEQQGRLGRVVMIGTPNRGSEVADHYSEKFWSDWFGEVPKSLTTNEAGIAQNLNEPNYPVGVIAGTKTYRWTRENFDKANDGLVSVDSAKISTMDAYWEVNLPHHQLRSDPKVIQQIVHYLKTGEFE
ncbi:alpha/beta fold hydrolase [Vibrio fortis]|uniref:alpha/beta fold hydrolase n=1 Tax=Vibrio fortis TaxID=212667 RepID=UPI003EBB409B